MASPRALTPKQQKIYDFIVEKIEEGLPPTVREIGEAFGIVSPNGVMCHLNALVTKGLISRGDQSARAIRLLNPPSRSRQSRATVDLPLVGSVAAGTPIAATPTDDRFDFGDMFCGPDHFVLKVKGQSMIEDHIDDGDFVVIREQANAENGERVVAMIDGEVTLKKFQHKQGSVVLHPCNGSMSPIVVDPDSDARVLGVLVGVLRKCR